MNANTTIHSTERRPLPDWIRHFNKRVANRVTGLFAGNIILGMVHHRGSRSGRSFQTPVLAIPVEDGFIIPLPYGEQTDWHRNVTATGGCRLSWQGRLYILSDPMIIASADALPALPFWMQPFLRGIRFLTLKRVSGSEPSANRSVRKILVYGAGVLGSLYAGKLHQAGYDVSILARGRRLLDLKEHGLVLTDAATGEARRHPVRVVDCLAPDDAYDLVLVIVRKNQLPSVLPALAANRGTPNVLFMVNNAEGPCRMVDALGTERVLLGFPGAGGERDGHVVRYHVTSGGLQPTTIGELDGSQSERLLSIAQALTHAGFPVALSTNMDAWLKTHVALVSPVANALYLAGGSNYRLARTRDGLVLLVRAVHEGLRVLRALNIPITPAKYRLLEWIPEPLLVAVLQRSIGTHRAELLLARHANAARDEMLTLAEEFRTLARCSGVPTPAMDALFAFTDPETPTVPEGQAGLRMDWRSTVAALLWLAAAILSIRWVIRKRRR